MKNKTKRYIFSALSSVMLFHFSVSAENVTETETADDLMSRIPQKVIDRIIDKRRPAEETAVNSENTAYNWYCKHTKNGEIPPCPPEMSFISEHDAVFLGNTDEKVIYLTFDAGYENGNIERILNTMKEKGVTGAFFVLNNIVKTNPELIRRMADEGHMICNHTAKHKDMSKVTDISSFKAELASLNSACSDIGVTCAPFYRPPEGRFSEENLRFAKELGYTTVFWSFAYADWDNNSQPSPDKAKEKIISGTHNGMVLLLHPTSATNAKILGDLIDHWKSEGYRFGSLDELSQGKE